MTKKNYIKFKGEAEWGETERTIISKFKKFLSEEGLIQEHTISLKDFPPQIINKMLEHQQNQGNTKNIKVFERELDADRNMGGFSWDDTPEGYHFWRDILKCKNMNYFFEKYLPCDLSKHYVIWDK